MYTTYLSHDVKVHIVGGVLFVGIDVRYVRMVHIVRFVRQNQNVQFVLILQILHTFCMFRTI